MKVTIEIQCDNAAFDDGPAGSEVGRILHKLANKLHSADLEEGEFTRLMDYNGNHVGQMTVEVDGDE